MKKVIILFTIFINLFLSHQSIADEGMWLPHLISGNFKALEKLGCKLSPDDIYSLNKSSLKDAVVNFGNFCTGEIISAEGLLLTNHHCGFSSVQAQSSVEHNYLADGFWAKNKQEELKNTGLTVTFLIRVEDVTTHYFKDGGLVSNIDSVSEILQKEAVRGTHYSAEVKPFFERNTFYLFVNETYKDIRLVGVPPSSIGKFGGDTDNWMWPRHTGDFCLFRVYGGADGKPADYSPNNIPIKPRYFLPISTAGVKANDFAMVMGYPGQTERYKNSRGILMDYQQSNPSKIKIREQRLRIMKEAMDENPAIRIKYASKYARVSNYYKYFIGQNKGIERLNVIERKQSEEKDFVNWINADEKRAELYSGIEQQYGSIYETYEKINTPYVYFEECLFGNEILLEAYKASNTLGSFISTGDQSNIEKYKQASALYFKNLDIPTEKKIFIALLEMYRNDIPKDIQPSLFDEIQKKYKGNISKYADVLFSKSIFADASKMEDFLNKPQASILEKDPAFSAMTNVLGEFRSKVGPYLGLTYKNLNNTNHLFLKAFLAWKKDKQLYPDANFSMRLTYGSIQDYDAKDAVHYLHQTHLVGIIEKEDSTNDEFIVPKKLKSLYEKKDFGNYADQTGDIPVCFITNNDITGGNSGSPVINAKGELIGCAFDGNWEAMSGDIVFEPKLQRCISVDIRYVLFIIDKYAGADHLVKEMKLVP